MDRLLSAIERKLAETPDRRSFIKLAARATAATAGAILGLGSLRSRADAVACCPCCLPWGKRCSYCNGYRCPSGCVTKWSWSCCSSGCTYICTDCDCNGDTKVDCGCSGRLGLAPEGSGNLSSSQEALIPCDPC